MRFYDQNAQLAVTGIPKSGTNALWKACKLLNQKAMHIHTTDTGLLDKMKVVYVYRNPRNVLVSAVRYQNEQLRGMDQEVTQEKLRDSFFNFFNARLDTMYDGYAPWLDSSAYKVSLEAFLKNDQEMRRLAKYLGVGYNNTWEQLPGDTYTYMEEKSDWRQHWGPEIDSLWEEFGMKGLEEILGYRNNV